jgi:uncharacterized protein with HEPN domain
MSRHDDAARLAHMLDHAREAVALTRTTTFAEFQENRVLNLAVVRLLEIVGEAAARVGSDTRDRFPHVPWPQIIALRNRLIHGYESVDLSIVWQILRVDLPSLIREIEKDPRGTS